MSRSKPHVLGMVSTNLPRQQQSPTARSKELNEAEERHLVLILSFPRSRRFYSDVGRVMIIASGYITTLIAWTSLILIP